MEPLKKFELEHKLNGKRREALSRERLPLQDRTSISQVDSMMIRFYLNVPHIINVVHTFLCQLMNQDINSVLRWSINHQQALPIFSAKRVYLSQGVSTGGTERNSRTRQYGLCAYGPKMLLSVIISVIHNATINRVVPRSPSFKWFRHANCVLTRSKLTYFRNRGLKTRHIFLRSAIVCRRNTFQCLIQMLNSQ